MTPSATAFPCAAVLLAAGAARRMGGRPKLLLPIAGESLLRRAVRLARQVQADPIIVVLGCHAEPYCAELAGLTVTLVHNPDWRDGLGGSLRCGVAALPTDWPPQALFFVLTPDQPLVSAKQLLALRRLLEAHPSATAAACAYAGTVGVPALFRYVWRARLATAHGEVGARRYLAAYQGEVATLSFPDGACDIDTEEDYRAALNRLSALWHGPTNT
ncbi:MAG: nucleotidyltransferase family protein [Chloracidobacterium sp.]|nr:nucleotidyltransferase family protein [Chloracidobacterium sp.]MDW8218597.1 nucleotidyltransferase family protein [Acidobacteriota bacterium]